MTVFNTFSNYLENEYLEYPYLTGQTIAGLGVEVKGEDLASQSLGVELEGKKGKGIGVELFGFTEADPIGYGVQLQESNIGHTQCEDGQGYLEEAYLQDQPYLVGYICAGLSVQLEVQTTTGLGVQLNVIQYNTNRLRVLCDIDSRGDGNNWTANSTLPSSTDSFNVNNLNTDIVEQEYRSNNVVTGIALTCDGGIGTNIFLDTFIMKSHNLTTSAVVTLIGDDDPAFGSPGFNETFAMTTDDFVYIAPDAPITGFRYWRLNIDDPTNPDGIIKIGVVAFGASEVLNNNCFRDVVIKSPKDHKDTLFTEGFTNVMNERSLTKALKLDFSNILYDSLDWNTLQRIFNSSKTTLKCFWIPMPQYPTRFLMFAKMKEMPRETHNQKGEDFVNLTVNLDESL